MENQSSFNEKSYFEVPKEVQKKDKKPLIIWGVIILILIVGVVVLVNNLNKPQVFEAEVVEYIEPYRLVDEKISQSAGIKINFPEGFSKENATENVIFNPKISGEWVDSNEKDVLIFKPSSELNLNKHYAVKFLMGEVESNYIESDFYVVEDPEIVAIFPKADTEAPEDSNITIVFSRPMVPLTTLSYADTKNVPVKITPETEGRFKWITTKNLQFIPNERLIRSSNYNVEIKDGFVSEDDLKIDAIQNHFTTRNLRLDYYTNTSISYQEPIKLYFNQPVNLNDLKNNTVIKNEDNEEISFEMVFETTQKEDKRNFFEKLFRKKVEVETNESHVLIFNEKDKFQREGVWDFDKEYRISIAKIYPQEGDIIIDEPVTFNVEVSDIIKEVSSISERTNYSNLEMFDPKGSLKISFYEDIDLSQSNIEAGNLNEIKYGEKCLDEDKNISNCEKIEDKSVIYLTFKDNELKNRDVVDVKLNTIKNTNNQTINNSVISYNLVIYPELVIYNVVEEGLTNLTICSNNPIANPTAKDYAEYFSGTPYFDPIYYWSPSYLINEDNSICKKGEFASEITYGIAPKTDYSFKIKIEDVFGQTVPGGIYTKNFTSGTMENADMDIYLMQKSYNITSPNKTKLVYAVKNMDYIDISICKVNDYNFLKYVSNDQYKNLYCLEKVNKRIALDKIYWIKNYFTIDLKDYFNDPLGHYVINLSHPNLEYPKHNYISVTNLAVVEKQIRTGDVLKGEDINNLYWVNDINTLKPISGASIFSFVEDNFSLFGNTHYTKQGISQFEYIDNLKGTIVSYGEDSTIIPYYDSILDWGNYAYSENKYYVYTDKPIYRAGSQVYVKGIVREGYDGNYLIPENLEAEIRVVDPRGNLIYSDYLELNEYGTFNTTVDISKNFSLGVYDIIIKDQDRTYYSANFEVLEYVAAPFKVEATSDKEEYKSKENIVIDLNADYYFGVPVSEGDVSYSFTAQDYYFDKYNAENYNFTDFSWDNTNDKFLLRGETSLDENGKAQIEEFIDFEKLFSEENQTSKIFRVYLTVTNKQSQSISTEASFIVHAGDYYIGLNADKTFIAKNRDVNVNIKTVDTEGVEMRVDNLNLKAYKVEWLYNKRMESDGSYYYNWEKQRQEIYSKDFSTDDYGNSSQAVLFEEEGSYEIEVKGRDESNNLIFNKMDVYVFGDESSTSSIQIRDDDGIDIELEKNNLEVGDMANFIIKSPYKNAKALITLERGSVFYYDVIDITDVFTNYSFKVQENFIPNIYFTVTLITDKPEVKYGNVEVNIKDTRKEVAVEVYSDKNYYNPGDEVKLKIKTKDYDNQSISAELSLAVCDLSVLALKGNPKKDPISFFYGGFPLTITTSSNLKNILIDDEILKTKGGGGGAGSSEDKNSAEGKRGEFKETAYFNANIITDENGNAEVSFKLPDNLTTWQAEALGVTKDTKLGVGYLELYTQKDLMVVPISPIFTIPGDHFYIGAQVFNETQSMQKVKTSFRSDTLNIEESEKYKDVSVGAGQSETIYFKVNTPNDYKGGQHVFTISAKSSDFEDIVDGYIDSVQNETYESVSSFAKENKDTLEFVYIPSEVLESKGGLEIGTSATLGLFLKDSFDFLLAYPYGCTEQVASKVKAIAVLEKAFKDDPDYKFKKVIFEEKEYSLDEALDVGLSKIYENQLWDGGFTYWPNSYNSDYFLTLYVLNVLSYLRNNGYNVSEDVISSATKFISNEFSKNETLYKSHNTFILTVYTLSNLNAVSGSLLSNIINLINNPTFIEKATNETLVYLALTVNNLNIEQSLKDKVYNNLDNRIEIDSRGAFLDVSENVDYQNYETSIKNTALYLNYINETKKDVLVDKVMNWILKSRSNNGAWGSTNNTINVIDAFVNYMDSQNELNSDFTLTIKVNEDNESFDFNSGTIFEEYNLTYPIDIFERNKNNPISFEKKDNNSNINNYYYNLALKYYLPANKIAPRDEGITISKEFYNLEDKKGEYALSEANLGDILRGRITLTIPKTRNFVNVEDYIPAGMSIVNFDLTTEDQSLKLEESEIKGNRFYPNFKEIRNDQVFLYNEYLSPGVYEFDYYVRVTTKGEFIQLPSIAYEMYFPEVFGRTAGKIFEVK